jgi:hypothetical protein
MTLFSEAAGDLVLAAFVRLVGALWVVGAIFLVRQLRAQSAMDRMMAQISAAADELRDELPEDDPDRPPPRGDRAPDDWKDRDDRQRRVWLYTQAGLLMLTGGAMAFLHASAMWLSALLLGGQGVYFIWREWVRRRAPSPEAAEQAAPANSTVRAAWFSLAAASAVWIAGMRGLLL